MRESVAAEFRFGWRGPELPHFVSLRAGALMFRAVIGFLGDLVFLVLMAALIFMVPW